MGPDTFIDIDLEKASREDLVRSLKIMARDMYHAQGQNAVLRNMLERLLPERQHD
jgi:hypothetical protein